MTKIILCMYEVVKRIIKSNLNLKNKVIIVLFLMMFSGCVCVCTCWGHKTCGYWFAALCGLKRWNSALLIPIPKFSDSLLHFIFEKTDLLEINRMRT